MRPERGSETRSEQNKNEELYTLRGSLIADQTSKTDSERDTVIMPHLVNP